MEATTIIWATDGSDLADRALEFVHDLAQKWTTPPRIVAVHVDQRWTGREMNVSKLAGEEDLETSLPRSRRPARCSERRQGGTSRVTNRRRQRDFDVAGRVVSGCVVGFLLESR